MLFYPDRTSALVREKLVSRRRQKIVAGVLGLALVLSLGMVPAVAAPNAGADEMNPSAAPSSAPAAPTPTPPGAAPAPQTQTTPVPEVPAGPGAYMGSGLSTAEPAAADAPPAVARSKSAPLPETRSTPAGVPGVDVSGWQANPATNYVVSTVNWATQWAMGARFAYTKATEGNYFIDASRASHQKGAAAVGMLRGSYHFALPSQSSAVSQANFFVNNGGGWTADGSTLPPLLDIENNPYDDPKKKFYLGNSCYNMTPSAMVAWIKSFSATVLAKTGRLPMIYTNYYWWQECTGGSKEFTSQALHIAAYGASSPWIPGGWKNYNFWQYSATGPFAGDSNVWNGTLATLRAFAKASDAPTAAPAPTPTPTPSIGSAADLVTADSSGALWNYPATGTGSYGARKKIGAGWTGLRSLHVIDWDANGTLDIVAQWSGGSVSLYRGLPAGGFGSPATLVTSGWGNYQLVIGYWLNASKYPQILTRATNGELRLWSNPAGSALTSSRQIGNGWAQLNLTMLDFDGDGKQDLLAQQPSGALILYRSNGSGSFVAEPRKTIGLGWHLFSSVTVYSGFTAPGSVGLVGRNAAGTLSYYPVPGNTKFGAASIIGQSFTSHLIAGGEDINLVPPTTSPQLRPSPTPPPANPSIVAASDVVTVDAAGKLWRTSLSASGLGKAAHIGGGFTGATSIHVIDWDSDGVLDLLVQWTNGKLILYRGARLGGFTATELAASGWAAVDITTGQWVKGAKYPSILARDQQGDLHSYTTSNGTTLSAATTVTKGLTRVHPMMTDFDGDGSSDILGIDNIGRMSLYRSNGKGSLISEPRPIVGTGWNGMSSVSAANHVQGPGSSGIVARALSGAVYFYPIAKGKFGVPTQLTSSWQDRLIGGSASLSAQQALTSTADLARADSSGVLWAHRANGQGDYDAPYPMGIGWKGVKSLHVADWDADGVPDLLTQWTSGALSVYPGIRAGGFKAPVLLARSGWADITFITGQWRAASPLPDLVGKNARGELFHWPNQQGTSLGSARRIGVGWGSLTLAMQDFDSDRKNDILAVDGSGKMYLYRGNGQGSFAAETRPVIGLGWGSFSHLVGSENFVGAGSRGVRAHFPNGQVFYYPISGQRRWGTPISLPQRIVGSATS